MYPRLFGEDWSRAPLEQEAVYLPGAMDLFSVKEARERVRCCLAEREQEQEQEQPAH